MVYYLAVPYEDKNEAKDLGACWDPAKKKWYVPSCCENKEELMKRWPINHEPLHELVGENTAFSGKELFVDMLPESSWGMTLHNCVHPSDWDRLKNFIDERAHFKCECCDGEGPLDAHERWSYNEETKTQKLMRVVALCKPCHETTHLGLSQIRGREILAINHFMQVRNIDEASAMNHVNEAMQARKDRDSIEWKLDFSIITNSGIKLVDDLEQRRSTWSRFSRKRASTTNSIPLGDLSAQLGLFNSSNASDTLQSVVDDNDTSMHVMKKTKTSS